MPKASELLKIQLPLSRQLVERTHPQWVKGLDENFSSLITIAESFERDMETARKNDLLSGLGKSDAVEKAGLTALAKLAVFEQGPLAVVANRTSALSHELTQAAEPKRPSEPTERLVYELRLQEIRAQLRDLDDAQRRAIYTSASDPMVIDAMEMGPPTVVKVNGQVRLIPFIDPVFREEMMTARARNTSPARAAELEGLQEFGNTLRSAVATVKTAIQQELPSLAAAYAGGAA